MDKARIDKVFNRLRARLYNMVEGMRFEDTQLNAHKQTIKDVTSAAWNDIANISTDAEDDSISKESGNV